MSQRTKIKALLESEQTDVSVIVKGWVRTFRNNQFIALNDGSTNNNLQVVIDFENTDPAFLKRITTGAAISVSGTLVASLGKGQKVEVKAKEIEILGDCDPEKYPLQLKNRPSLEFLREIAHLRFRTNTFGAIFRVRNSLSFAIHQFFQERGFVYLHTPIITASDAEGAGETFHVTNFDLANPPKTENGEIDFKEDFFGRATNLTVSGQLEGELAAMALSDIYTFGPTFRAENSNTTRHLAEFWMIEPEMAFYDLNDNMDLAEALLKYVIKYALEKNAEDIEFLTYTEAIEILKESTPNKKKKFQYPVEGWGTDLQSEHERYLVEKHFKKPVILTDYPKEIKAFYMRQNDDGKTVRAMDVLFPGIGEMVGGSQREERLDKLEQRMDEMGIPKDELWWYLDTRRFGACPHAGFGLGFERLVLFVTGMGNIRDVIPFPRYPKNAEF
jgi:asparaginyl-tRNA synthetase